MTPQIGICIAAPLLIFLALYFFKPSFVQRSDGGKSQRIPKKYSSIHYSLPLWYGLRYGDITGSLVRVCKFRL